jgi:hypothetical protein
MICHIRLGKLSWCQAPYAKRADLALVADEEGIVLACSHVSRQKADRMVGFLHRYKVDGARVVESACPQES